MGSSSKAETLTPMAESNCIKKKLMEVVVHRRYSRYSGRFFQLLTLLLRIFSRIPVMGSESFRAEGLTAVVDMFFPSVKTMFEEKRRYKETQV